MKAHVMKGDKMFESYSKYVGENEKKIIDDFCNKVKNEMIGDLTLDEYSRFRFWKYTTDKELNFFHDKFTKDMDCDMNFDSFCDLLWNALENVPDWMSHVMDNIKDIKDIQIGEA